jgi:hypothetical protein
MKQKSERVGETAKLALEFRAWAGDRNARRLSRLSGARKAFREILGDSIEEFAWLRHTITARDDAMKEMFRQYPTRNMVELAGGLSPRSLDATKDGRTNYIFTDLPGMVRENRRIVGKLLGGSKRSNLHWLAVDATVAAHFRGIERLLEPGSVSVFSEGLWPYFSPAERPKAGMNVAGLIDRPCSYFYTADVMDREGFRRLKEADPSMREILEAVSGLTGHDFEKNAPKTLDAAEREFNRCGLTVIRHRVLDLIPPLSARGSERKKVLAMIERMSIWQMQVK